MRREGKGTGQMTDPQCMVHTAPATATDSGSGRYVKQVCSMSNKTEPPTELQIPATVTTLVISQLSAMCVFSQWILIFSIFSYSIFLVGVLRLIQ